MNDFLTKEECFNLLNKYGSPLYVYDEDTIRKRTKEMMELLPNKKLIVDYSFKANNNIELLKIIKSEGAHVDAMSPIELSFEKKAGYKSNEIMYVCNNISSSEMKDIIDEGVLISVDSISQLETYGKLNPGGDIIVRFNPGVGSGHHEKVITGGKKTKFGVQREFIEDVKKIIEKYKLNLVGINQHIGSLFLNYNDFLEGVKNILEIAHEFNGLKIIDLGGGFGVPYHNEERLNLKKLSIELDKMISNFLESYDNKDVTFYIEPGRYIVAEAGIIIGSVTSIKENYNTNYLGCDIGYNTLMRPILYDSYHEIKVLQKEENDLKETYTVVGNIGESGDILGSDRLLSKSCVDDAIIVYNAGAYGYSMASNYNLRCRPAEVLITSDHKDILIRKRDTLEGMLYNFIGE